jgi:hypothetical protein
MTTSRMTFTDYEKRIATSKVPLEIGIYRLTYETETLHNAFYRDWMDPNLDEFRPDLEDWMRQQLGELLRCVTHIAGALGTDLDGIAMKDVTQT